MGFHGESSWTWKGKKLHIYFHFLLKFDISFIFEGGQHITSELSFPVTLSPIDVTDIYNFYYLQWLEIPWNIVFAAQCTEIIILTGSLLDFVI